MAIPFYEPRPQHSTECDQVDGHFPPAPPSCEPMSVPPANENSNIPITNVVQPTGVANFLEPTSTASSSSNAAAISSSGASTSNLGNAGQSAATATFSFSSNNPTATASYAANATSSQFTPSTFSTTSAPNATEPLPWKLLAVSMCKALKQYYQQNGANSVFTTAVIEILPSGVSTAQD